MFAGEETPSLNIIIMLDRSDVKTWVYGEPFASAPE